jgi:hypothetical protein
MSNFNHTLANTIAKRLRASGESKATAHSVIKSVVFLCLEPTSAEHKEWQTFIGKTDVDEQGQDSEGVFLLGLSLNVRQGYKQAQQHKNQTRFLESLDSGTSTLDITPLLRSYNRFLETN